jgi:hypothetical protein
VRVLTGLVTLRSLRAVIERFDVPPGDDEAFLAAWASAGEPGARLLRALRDDAPHRFVAIAGDAEVGREHGDPSVEGGVWRVEWTAAETGWGGLAGRRGFLGARLYRVPGGYVEVQRWSSPLMVQRAGLAGALYVAVLPS